MFNPIQTLLAPPAQPNAAQGGATEDQIAELRRYAEALRAGKQPVRHWLQGVSNVAADVMSGYEANKADQMRNRQQQDYIAALGGGGNQAPVQADTSTDAVPSAAPISSGGGSAGGTGTRPSGGPEAERAAILNGTWKPAPDYQAGIDSYKQSIVENPALAVPPPGGITGVKPADLATVLAAIPGGSMQSAGILAGGTPPDSALPPHVQTAANILAGGTPNSSVEAALPSRSQTASGILAGGGTPPQQVAQAIPAPAPGAAGGGTAPQDQVRQMAIGLIRGGMAPAQAITTAAGMVQARQGFLPKGRVDEKTGDVWRDTPGQLPQLVQPGAPEIQSFTSGQGITRQYQRAKVMDPNSPAGWKYTPWSLFQPPGVAQSGSPQPGGTVATQPGGPSVPPSSGQIGRPYPGDAASDQEIADWREGEKAKQAGLIKGEEMRSTLAEQGKPEVIAAAASKARQEELAKEMAKGQVKPVNEAIDHSAAAQKALNYLGLMDQIGKVPDASKITTGPLAETFLKAKQGIKDMFGLDLGGIAPAEAIEKFNGYLASEAAREMTNRVTQFDFKTFLERNPGINNSPEGRQLLIDGLRGAFQQDIELGKLASRIKDPSEWADMRDKYIQEHPIKMVYRGQEVNSAQPLPGLEGIASPPAAPPAPASIDYLKSNPDANTRALFDQRYGQGAAAKALGK